MLFIRIRRYDTITPTGLLGYREPSIVLMSMSEHNSEPKYFKMMISLKILRSIAIRTVTTVVWTYTWRWCNLPLPKSINTDKANGLLINLLSGCYLILLSTAFVFRLWTTSVSQFYTYRNQTLAQNLSISWKGNLKFLET